MSGNQREMERREKRANKEKRQKRIVWIILAVIVLALAVMKICEINVNSIKNHFTDENGDFTLTEGVVEDAFPYSIDSSNKVSIVNINNKLGIITPSSFSVLNSSDAEIEYTFAHGYSNPILKTAGIYSLVYDQGAKNYRLDTVNSSVYEEECANTLLCADVSKNGNVVYASTSKIRLCDICVFNKSLKNLYSESISDGYVISIALSENGRKIAYAVVSGENANLVTTVYAFDIASNTQCFDAVVLPQGSLIDLSFSGNNIFVVGDSYAGVIKKSGEYNEIFEQGSISTICNCYTPSGDLVIAYSSYSNSSENVIAHIKPSASVKCEIKVNGNVKSVSASSSIVSVLTSSNILNYNLSNGELKREMKTDDSAKMNCIMGSDVFVHKQSVIERCGDDND